MEVLLSWHFTSKIQSSITKYFDSNSKIYLKHINFSPSVFHYHGISHQILFSDPSTQLQQTSHISSPSSPFDSQLSHSCFYYASITTKYFCLKCLNGFFTCKSLKCLAWDRQSCASVASLHTHPIHSIYFSLRDPQVLLAYDLHLMFV